MANNPHAPSLNAIVAATRTRVAALRERAREIERRAAAASAPRQFPPRGRTVGVIAEVKRRSPSQGAIREDLDPVAHARSYERGGAVGVSVLTDGVHFGGSIDDLVRVADAVRLPVLRKDFVIDPVQVHEARAAGASAVLLIARILRAAELKALAALVRATGMLPLIEVHTPEELDAALAATPGLLGVNARDLDTFAVDTESAVETIRRVPPELGVVAESGVEGREDVERFATAGADFVLVGTSVARRADPAAAVRALVGVERRSR